MALQTDEDLLDAWRGGDLRAGDQLFERHFKGLFRFFRSKVDEVIAEDLTQATFVACVTSKQSFQQSASFRSYLFGIARNQLFMHFRRRNTEHRHIEFTSESVQDLGAGPATLAAERDEQKLLLAALRRIPVDFQIAIELYYWQGLSTAELAELLDIPAGTVRSRLTRARTHLTTKMKELASSPALAESTIGDFERWARSLKSPTPSE